MVKKYLITILGVILVSAGCVAQKPLPPEERGPGADQQPKVEQQGQVLDERNEALRLSNLVNKTEGVKNATVVIVERTAYVGLRLADAQREENQIQEEVTDAILKESPRVETVYVATHPDTVARIEQIYLDIQAGRIASTFEEELRQIKVGGQ